MKTIVAFLLLASAVSAHIHHRGPGPVKVPTTQQPPIVDYTTETTTAASVNVHLRGNGFLECCKAHNVSHSCQNLCSYNTRIEDVYKAFSDKTCDVNTDLAPFSQCKYNFKDARSCCRAAAGSEIMKGHEYCLDLCDGTQPVKFTPKFFECPQVQGAFTECGLASRIEGVQFLKI